MPERGQVMVSVRAVTTPPLTLLRLRGSSDADRQRIAELIGAPLTMTPNHAVDGAVRVLWTAPEAWLIIGDTAQPSAIEGAASDAIAALCVSVTDGRCVFEICGPQATDLLAKGTSLDIERALPDASRSAATLFAQVNAVIDSPSGPHHFRVIVDVSVRDYVEQWLRDARIEFG